MDADRASNPFFFADQDVLNAVLSSEIDPSRIELLPRPTEAIIPFAGLKVADETTLRCVYDDGTEPYALHHYLPAKPWLEPTMPGVYTQLMMRLLHSSDVAIRLPGSEIPSHLRTGPLGAARRWCQGYLPARLGAARDRLLGSAEPAGG